MKLEITKIYRNTKDKNGQPLISKMGKPYEKVSIKAEKSKYKDKYINGFGAEWNSNWKIGDIVDIKIEENGEWLNFTKVSELDELRERIDKIEIFINDYKTRQDKFNNPHYEEDNQEEPKVKESDLPF